MGILKRDKAPEPEPLRVVALDISIGSLVDLLIEVALAAIPAAIIFALFFGTIALAVYAFILTR